MSEQTPNLSLPYIMPAQAQKHVTHNEAIRALDAIVQLAVADRDLVQPPSNPTEGVRYIVAANAVGPWLGMSGRIAAFQDGAWAFYVPQPGWLAWVADEEQLCAFDAGDWQPIAAGSTEATALLGINTTADAVNRLAVASQASLFTHVGADHRQKINKATPGDVASHVYQTGYSGRAEIGLAGDDDFHFKVSPDGAAWQDALVLVAATGTPRVPTFAVALLPSASVAGAGAIVYVPDAPGGATLAMSDGATWSFLGGSGSQPQAATPTFAPAAGSYSSAQSVTLTTATAGAVIHYTTNGATPTGASPVYSAPISVPATATIKALAIAPGHADSPVANATYTIAASAVPFFVFLGESNSGGVAPNTSATVGELAPRSALQIWNKNTAAFEALDIGTNNMIGHVGAESSPIHGMELQLAADVEDGRFTQNQAYLVKTAQGGSLITQWDVGNASGYWAEAVTRIGNALAALATAGKTPIPYIFISLGINDGLGSSGFVNAATYKTKMIDLIARLRTILGATTPVCLTKFENMAFGGYPTYGAAMDEIDAADPYTKAVTSAGTTLLGDQNHWDYLGMKTMTERMLDAALTIAGNAQSTAPSIAPASGSYASAQTITISTAAAAMKRYASGANDPAFGTLYTGPFSLTPPGDVLAVAFERDKPMSPVVQRVYELDGGTSWSAADVAADTPNMTLSNGNRTAINDNAVWRSNRSTTAKSTGKWYVEWKVLSGTNNAFFILGFANAGFNPTSYLGTSAQSTGKGGGGSDYRNGAFVDGAGNGGVTGSPATNDVWASAIDMDAGKIWYFKNNVARGTGNAAAGTDPDETFTPATTGPLHAAISLYQDGGIWRLDATSAQQTHTPPSGFTAWG